jgi:hypothetical protein
VPRGVEGTVLTVRVEVELGPAADGRDRVGPLLTTGEMEAAKLAMLLKPKVPCTVIAKVVDEPFEKD